MRDTSTITWRPIAHVDKFDDDQVAYVQRRTGLLVPSGDVLSFYCIPEVAEDEGNLLVTTGLDRITKLIIGAAGQALTATALRLGVGNGATGAAIGDTDLSASPHTAPNQWYQIMDATYPQQANGVITAKATVATGDGNFPWNEWGLDVGTPTVVSSATVGTLVNHKTSAALGTKVSGAWALTVTVTIT